MPVIFTPPRYIFRFDDICSNLNMEETNKIADYLKKTFGNKCEIWYCVSPLTHNMKFAPTDVEQQRIYPKIMNAQSDHTIFYKVDQCGVPEIPEGVRTVSHGLIHVDHRLLSREAQEMSIVTSCSLVKSQIFVPPFNKWNKDTVSICEERSIRLIKFEDGWKCLEYNYFFPETFLWYLHSREFSLKTFKEKFQDYSCTV